MVDIKTQLQTSVAQKVVTRLPLADQLSTEHGVATVIQSLSDIVQTLSDRVATLEASSGVIITQ